MSDESNVQDNQSAPNASAPGLPVMVHAQYIKDMSFENPNASENLKPGLPSLEMDMNINIDADKVESTQTDRLFEVLLTVTATAAREGKPVFVSEVVYGALVSIQKDLPEKHIHPLLFTEIPQILYPFARHMIATMTQGGGYPPLMLNPVDFRGMYVARFAQKKSA